MFQTELNLWLQAHGGPSLTWLMWMISEIGREEGYMLVLVFLTFGADLRRGWLVGQVLLWTAGVTDYAKHFLALPRPLHVDARVLYPPSGKPSQEVFTARGATSFLDCGLDRAYCGDPASATAAEGHASYDALAAIVVDAVIGALGGS